jgi:hypothetical protein
MIITKKFIPRRTILRGVGVSLALPLLDAMIPALTASAKTAAQPIQRFGAVYAPNGMAMEYWTPKAVGQAYEFSPILKPLERYRDRFVLISGLNGPKGGAHAGGSTGFLTAMSGAESSKSANVAGISIDQIMARAFGKQTQIGSLELTMDRDASGACDGEFSCTLVNTVAWRDPKTPLPMQDNPAVVFERLFGDSGTDSSARHAASQKRRSILDAVTSKVSRLEQQVGVNDRGKIEQYLDSVRDLEQRLQRSEEHAAREIPTVPTPQGIPATYDEHAKLMFDLQVLAYQADLTRVATFMFGHEQSARNYPELGVAEGHHPLSHHGYDPGKIASLAKINTYHTTLFAYHLDKLASIPDGDGSLLDHTLLLYGAGISDSHAHSHTGVPLMLAGNANGRLRGGRHIMPTGTPTGNFLVAIMQTLGLAETQLGNSNGVLDLATG